MLSMTDSQSQLGSAQGYLDLDPVALAIYKFITTSPALHCRSIAPVLSGITTTLDAYISKIISSCGAPNIVSYATLYHLAAISRNCTCGRSAQPDSSDGLQTSWNDVIMDDSAKPPSLFSHCLSQAFTRSPLSRVRQSHWVGHHIFLGSFMVALQAHQGRLSFDALSGFSGFPSDELEDLLEAFVSCMDKDTALALEWMIKQGEFRSLTDVECPVVVMRRKRAKRARKGSEEHHAQEHAHFRRLFSIRRRMKPLAASDSLESSTSMSSSVSSMSS